jgi:hypothetical protein
MSKFATIYGLLYGSDHRLHTRFLQSLYRFAPFDEVVFHFWCNTVCKQTQDLLRRYVRDGMPATYYFSEENVKKYKLMRDLFHHTAQPDTPWIVWFDDDSYIDKGDWWSKTKAHITKTGDDCYYMGQPWYVHHLPGQWDFIRAASWFKNKPPELCPTRNKKVKKPGITFAQGAYWWLRTDIMTMLDWPDPRLNHNGGDTLLGEAIRQQGLPLTKFHYGVAINKAKRRGFHEKPAGSTVDARR